MPEPTELADDFTLVQDAIEDLVALAKQGNLRAMPHTEALGQLAPADVAAVMRAVRSVFDAPAVRPTSPHYADHYTSDYASRTAAGCEAAGEPVFLLRAQDVHAPVAVREWARQVRLSPGGAEAAARQLADEADRIADAMEAWPHRRNPG